MDRKDSYLLKIAMSHNEFDDNSLECSHSEDYPSGLHSELRSELPEMRSDVFVARPAVRRNDASQFLLRAAINNSKLIRMGIIDDMRNRLTAMAQFETRFQLKMAIYWMQAFACYQYLVKL